MILRISAALSLVVLATPVMAQSSSPAPAQQTAASAPITPQTTQPAQSDDAGLSIVVSDDNAWQDLGIAIPAFATDRNVPTPANSNGTQALGLELARVITSDLKNNGLFRPVGPDSLPRPEYSHITAPVWNIWNGRSADMLVHGYVRASSNNELTVGCYLYDVSLETQLAKGGWVVQPSDWRRAAHKCADMVYSRLSGENPFFDSKIAYIAETGPKGKRVKRLADRKSVV